jgi:hypothetical protein
MSFYAMAELNLPKFVQLTLEQAVPAPVAERLARTSFTVDELALRRRRMWRVFGVVMAVAVVLILIAGAVAAVRALQGQTPVRATVVADQVAPTTAAGSNEADSTTNDTTAASVALPISTPKSSLRRAVEPHYRKTGPSPKPKKALVIPHSS